MADVAILTHEGRTLVIPNTTASAVISALGTGEGQASFTLSNGEIVGIGNEDIESLAQTVAGSVDSSRPGGEESRSGQNPAGPGT